MRTLKPGTVVEFTVEADTWVGSFPIRPHRAPVGRTSPNGRDVMVIATGDLWVVNPARRSGERLLPALEAALQVRDPDGWILSPWIYTKSIVIDERAIPFSHPVLTLHTRHLTDDELLLSTFVHEQFHWFLAEQPEATEQAIADLRTVFPRVPTGGREGGRNEYSTYLHLLVCYLEQWAGLQTLGELKAKRVMDFWATDHYIWVYQTVIGRSRDIDQIMRDRKLIPAR